MLLHTFCNTDYDDLDTHPDFSYTHKDVNEKLVNVSHPYTERVNEGICPKCGATLDGDDIFDSLPENHMMTIPILSFIKCNTCNKKSPAHIISVGSN